MHMHLLKRHVVVAPPATMAGVIEHASACRPRLRMHVRRVLDAPCPCNTATWRRASSRCAGKGKWQQRRRSQGSFSPSRAISTAPSRVLVPPMKPGPPPHLFSMLP